MVTNPERLIRSIMRDVRACIYPLACASEIAGNLFFTCHMPLEDIRAKQVYPLVSEQMGLSLSAASRRVQRLAHRCWNCMVERDLVFAYIGRELERCPNACRLVGYLSFYAYLFVPYYVAIENEPSLLFAPDMELPQFSGNRPCGYGAARDWPLPVSRMPLFEGAAFPACPCCGGTLEGKCQNFCGSCGQRLNWSDFLDGDPVPPKT